MVAGFSKKHLNRTDQGNLNFLHIIGHTRHDISFSFTSKKAHMQASGIFENCISDLLNDISSHVTHDHIREICKNIRKNADAPMIKLT